MNLKYCILHWHRVFVEFKHLETTEICHCQLKRLPKMSAMYPEAENLMSVVPRDCTYVICVFFDRFASSKQVFKYNMCKSPYS